jgi:hypothetical protein
MLLLPLLAQVPERRVAVAMVRLPTGVDARVYDIPDESATKDARPVAESTCGWHLIPATIDVRLGGWL